MKAKPARNGFVQPQYSLWIIWILIRQDSQEIAFISVKLNQISLCLQVRHSQHMIPTLPSFIQIKISKNPSTNSSHPLPTQHQESSLHPRTGAFSTLIQKGLGLKSHNTRLMAMEGQKGLYVPIFQDALWGRKNWHQSQFSKWKSNINFLPLKATGLRWPLPSECLEDIKVHELPAQAPPIHELVPLK